MDSPLHWDPSYSVNIAELDQQHQQLFRTLGELEHALHNHSAESIVDAVLATLIQYTIHHFAAEERLMQQNGFPGLHEHRNDHQVLAQKLTKFNLSRKAGHPEIPTHLLPFLKTWWQEHVLKTDKEYTAFLNSKGIC